MIVHPLQPLQTVVLEVVENHLRQLAPAFQPPEANSRQVVLRGPGCHGEQGVLDTFQDAGVGDSEDGLQPGSEKKEGTPVGLNVTTPT